MAQPHPRIGTMEIELRIGQESLASSLMDRIAALREPRLQPLLQRVLEELSPPGRLDRLDALQLDLGPLPLEGFEEAFLARLEPALRQALTRQLRENPSEDPTSRALEVVRVYARTGNLPWWAEHSDRDLIGGQIRWALQQAPASWWALVRELEANPTALQRLAAACDGPTLAALLEAGQVNPRLAMASLVGRARLLRGLAQGDRGGPEPLPMDHPLPSPPAPERLRSLLAQGLRGDALWRALEQGEGADPGSAPHPPPESLASETAPAPSTEAWLDLLQTVQAWKGDGEAITGSEGDGAPPDLLALLPEPLRSLVAQGLRGEALRRALAERLPAADPLAPGPQPEVPPRSAPDPADPDELSLEDGGLVILWPFLETLLSRLEFIDPRRRVFPHEEARNQAIALLSFLVDGDPDPPEWRLALAKVLCGLSPLAPWQLENPLKPEALAEGERLLEAVISHGGLAEEMGPQDLRGLILRRPAVLTSRTGAWLLRVERRPEDALLDRFPWGWSWIRLPWMDHPLQVEW